MTDRTGCEAQGQAFQLHAGMLPSADPAVARAAHFIGERAAAQ